MREDRGLDAIVDGDHTVRPVADRVRLGTGDLGSEINPIGSRLGSRCGEKHGFGRVAERSRHRSDVAQVAGEAARVDPGDARNAESLEERREILVAAPVAAAPGKLAHDDAAAEGTTAFVVERHRSVVADVRIRERDDLARVGRVGDHLLIARQDRVEHDLAGCGAAGRLGPDCLALEHFAIGQNQRCLADLTHTQSFAFMLLVLIVWVLRRPRPAPRGGPCGAPCLEACGLRTGCCATCSPWHRRAPPT
ncbi:unannotated protein [freshwater metagenome]|uniref:Unannotated protein n=1 Tax=freshwater metagenome TaxID=449393 RepID=A0A6J7AM90_9ZZZZ